MIHPSRPPRPPAAIVDPLLVEDGPSELERMLVAGALVVRKGEHYRIESGAETYGDLELAARRLGGVCDCGAPLSSREAIRFCRTCPGEYPMA